MRFLSAVSESRLGHAAVEHDQKHVRRVHRVLRAFHADALRLVARVAQSRRIDQPHRHAAEYGAFIQHVPRGARVRGHDRTILSEQSVQKRAFAHVRTAEDRDLQSVAQHASPASLLDQRAKRFPRGFDPVVHGFVDLRLVRIVDRRFDRGAHVEQQILRGRDAPADAAAELFERGFAAVLGLRVDHVHHRLRLRKIKLAVQKGALGKLARLRRHSARFGQRFKHGAHGFESAVAMQLEHVLAGIAFRRAEQHRHAVVDGLTVFDDLCMPHPVRGFEPHVQHGVRHRARIPAGDANHDDRAADGARRGKYGIEGFVHRLHK